MSQIQPSTSLLPLVGRVYWMMVGPMILVALAFTIIRTGNGWFTPADLAFLGVLAGLFLARWLEFLGGNPQTSDGKVATWRHFFRYVLVVLVIGLGAWIVANLLGNHWLAA